MPPTTAVSVTSTAVERTATTLEAIRSKIPTKDAKERVEAKYDVVLDSLAWTPGRAVEGPGLDRTNVFPVNAHPNLELHSAAASGNIGLVHYALTHGQPVNSLLHGCLPIHAASSGGSVGVVRMLLDRGADVNAPRLPRRYSGDTKRSGAPAVGTAGSTPLHFAAANGHAQVVQILLASGAVPDKQDKNGLTPEDLAEMSGYNEVVHTIRVWYQINGRASTSASAVNVRSRANSFASNQSDVTEASVSGSSARKSKERASSMVSAASEKGLRLLRGSFDGKFQRNGSSTNDVSGALRSDGSDSGSIATPYMEPINTSDLPSPVGGDLSSPGGDEDTEETITPDTHQPPTPTSPVDTVSPNFSKEKTSRRPSLPSILEKAAHPGVAFRNRMRKVEGGQNTGAIAEHCEDAPESSQHDDQASGIRGRLRPSEIKAKMDKAKVDKQAILKMFKRDYSPPSRSPSPPPRRAEPAPHPAQVEHDIARLRRASMDPDLFQMAMDAQTLGERLEMSAITTSAPAAKTRFFESVPPSPSVTSYSDRQPAKTNGADRPGWERRLSRHSTISPSPLANEWGRSESSDGPRNATVRRTLTEVRKPSGEHKGPRRMPSAPSMPSMTSQSIAAFKERQSLSHTPSMTARNGESLTAASSGDGIDSSVIVPKLEALAQSRSRETTESSPHEGSSTSTALPPPSTSSVLDTPSTEAGTDATPTAPSGLKTPPEVAVSEYLEPPQAENDAVEASVKSDQTGRFRGESIGSNQTDSTGGVLTTPPSSRVLTPPGSRHPSVGDELDVRCMGLVPTESNALPGIPRTSESSLSAIAAKFPPVPENGLARNMPSSAPPRPPVRTISSHAEAKTAMEQAERDVLELAQVPDTASANRDLASQLAAYGETHAIAQEFERAERRTSRTSRSSSDRTSQMSSHLSMTDRVERHRVSSHPPHPRSVHSRSGSVPSPSLESASEAWMPMPVNHIYDRREQAYRERLNALTSAAAATTAHHRLPTKSQRYGHISDMWATGQSSSSLQRRITSPSHRMNGAAPTKNGTSGSGTYPSSLSVTPSLNNSLSNSMASGGKPIMRSSSLTRPTKPGGLRNDARYQGLAAARSYAATSPHAAAVRPRHKSDGHDDRQSSEAERDSPVVPNGFVLPDYPQRKVSRKQKFKTALGNLTRR
ncbi:hypothetical protein A1Q1_01236 [Trichosporon asahii var. asahii CBS 2479]|uniref:Uncharacterized protein n=1 Tax=Trichosporon asahii var. asahii (strain ATCC 90039 / CBS 2479 / JCM 2466 / KCTC 7840 / NBRC 103889/ NCYC 2677 / UAMH 7654) TaxID=1186058 RepID=J6F329_TRIAS|nr:hypothetical protein A1Q1_01236 [Trichosporon asahii var. asahii CBS 2479]EJT49607.1 hypothetical protein A1Q1_01236 [Trichosporon asahii var. asahii CBS 2479]